MKIIDRDYVKKLFKYIEKHEEMYVPYKKEDHYSEDKLSEKLPEFLDTVSVFADKHNVSEYTGTDPYTYQDNRFYYYLTYDCRLVEIGMYYSGNLCYIMNSFLKDDEEVIDCEDILKELEEPEDSKKVTEGTKGLTFIPSKKNNKKENN